MILLTGASGFIGKHLLNQLVKSFGKENIIALTSSPIDKCHYLIHDDYQFDSDVFIKSGFDQVETIIHAGAFTPKNSNQANDLEKCNRNIVNTELLLNSFLPNLKKIVYLSTLDVYGLTDTVSEESNINPISLYGHSKLYCEKMIEVFARNKNILHQILRLGHVYGPGEETYQKLIPVTINRILKGDTLEIWGTGKEIRSFIYIDDVVAAIVKSLEIEEFIKPINIVGGQHVSVKGLINIIQEVTNYKGEINFISKDFVGRNLVFDNSKLKRFLLAKETNLVDGLRQEWEYMKTI